MNEQEDFFLYIVAGKTTTTLAMPESTKQLGSRKIVRTLSEKLNSDDFDALLSTLIEQLSHEPVKKVFVCSVYQALNAKIESYFQSKEIEIIFLTNQNQSILDLSKLYNPWDLGPDLIAQLIYITRFFKEAIIVSLGTVTAIHHAKDNASKGVILMPGVHPSLHQIETLLDIRLLELKFQKKPLGLNNQEAISIGVVNTIEIVVDNLVKKLRTKCPIIYTGGGSIFFHNKNWWYIEDLDLLGLYIFSRRFLEKED